MVPAATEPLALLGGRTPEAFMREHWQKRPLLVRGALPRLPATLSADILAGLACEDEVVSRLVQERHRRGPWQVSYGPFASKMLQKLPKSHWTLLVNDCEKHLPELCALIEPFRFIPDWRIDDLQISYAADQGSVGAHYDDYDVFLLQLEGRREWRFGHQPLTDPGCIDGLELRLLQRFEPDETVIVEPGDLLYLPPRIGHHGIANGPCMTASIGFRAPALREILQAWSEELIQRTPRDARYTDPDLMPQSAPGEIDAAAVQRFRTLIQTLATLDDDAFRDWLGRYLTEPKFDLDLADPDLDTSALVDLDLPLRKSEFARVSFLAEQNELCLFANGRQYPAPLEFKDDIYLMSANLAFQPSTLPHIEDARLRALLIDLTRLGVLVAADGRH
ncbi:MAG: cupin domain-containing protein [Thiotrichales bacterium]